MQFREIFQSRDDLLIDTANQDLSHGVILRMEFREQLEAKLRPQRRIGYFFCAAFSRWYVIDA